VVFDTHVLVIEFFPLFLAITAAAGVMLSSEVIEQQEPSLQSFLRAVVDGKGYVYGEITLAVYVSVVGILAVFLLFLARIVLPLPYRSL
jgi:hypothetical protein